MLDYFKKSINFEKKIIKQLNELDKIKVNSIDESIYVLNNVISLINSDLFKTMISKRKNEKSVEYSIFKDIYKILDNIIKRNFEFLKVDFKNYIQNGENVFPVILKLFREMFKILEFDKINTKIEINPGTMYDFKNIVKKDLVVCIHLISIVIGNECMRLKKNNTNPFILKKYLDYNLYLNSKCKEVEKNIDNIDKKYILNILDYVFNKYFNSILEEKIDINQIILKNNYKVPNINVELNRLLIKNDKFNKLLRDHFNELISFIDHPEFKLMEEYITKTNDSKFNKRFDEDYLDNLEEIEIELEFLMKYLISKKNNIDKNNK